MTVKVGDKLFTETRFSDLQKVEVIKITPSGNIRVSDGALLAPNLRKKTGDAWDTSRYHLWTQELEDKYSLQKLHNILKLRLKSLDVYALDKQTTQKMLMALEEISNQGT